MAAVRLVGFRQRSRQAANKESRFQGKGQGRRKARMDRNKQSLQQGRESGNPEVGQALYRDKIAANSISCHKGGSLNTLLDLCTHPNTRDIHACP